MKYTVFLIIVVLVFFNNLIEKQLTAQTKMQAKIGVMLKADNTITRIRSKDRVKAGDEIKIFIIPMNDCVVYTIYTDNKDATLLNYSTINKKYKKDVMFILPNKDEFYKIDDSSPFAHICVICCTKKNQEIEKLFGNKDVIPFTKWKAMEEILTKDNKVKLNDYSDKPFTIAGNVRGTEEDFKKQLQLFTADQLLMKIYDLEVKK